MKVCMNNDLVKHRFIFVEDWVIEKSDKTDDQTEKKTLKQCYFGRFVSYFNHVLYKIFVFIIQNKNKL